MTPDPKVHNVLFGVSVRLAEELPVEWTRRHWDGTKIVRYHGEVDGSRGTFEVCYSASGVPIRVKLGGSGTVITPVDPDAPKPRTADEPSESRLSRGLHWLFWTVVVGGGLTYIGTTVSEVLAACLAGGIIIAMFGVAARMDNNARWLRDAFWALAILAGGIGFVYGCLLLWGKADLPEPSPLLAAPVPAPPRSAQGRN